MMSGHRVKSPKVSVVMAVYNEEKYLREAVDSVLKQSFVDFEFIIVNDGSTDRSEAIIRSYDDPRIRLLDQQNQGLSKSLNRAIRVARGELIARMDADDISEPERLAKQVAFLEIHPDCHLVGTNALYMTEDGIGLYETRFPQDPSDIQTALERLDTPFVHGSVMFRRDVVMAYGLYDESFPFSQDLILWVKLSRAGIHMSNLPEVLYRHRLSPGAVSSVSTSVLIKRRAVIRRYLETGVLTEEDRAALQDCKPRASEKERQAAYHLRVGKTYLEVLHDSSQARSHLLRALRFSPLCASAWLNLALCFVPASWMVAWKRWPLRQWLVWGR